MNIVFYDFETFWNSKSYTLSKQGPIEYIRDEQFDPFMLSLSINGAPASVCTDDAIIVFMTYTNPDVDVYCAHNGGAFDHLILSEHFNIRPKNLWDNIWLMRWAGISSVCQESHKALTEWFGHGQKEAGTVVSDNKHWPYDFTEQERQFFTQYCADDSNQGVANMKAMLPYMTNDCLHFMSITARMATEPVFILDAQILEEFIKQLDQEAEDARQKIMDIFHFQALSDFLKAIRSAETYAAMLRHLGVEPPVKVSEAKTRTAREKDPSAPEVMTYAFSKQDVEFLALLEHDDPRVRLLVEARLEYNSSVMRSRAETLLKFARHGKPLPVMLSAFKAHTSRYSAGTSEGASDKIQWQNLSKRNPAYLPLRRAIKVPAGYKVVAVDSSQVELRVNAWMAQQTDLLQQFIDGRDPYAELAVNFDNKYTAKEIHDGAKSGDKYLKLLRNTAKMLALGSGYGTGYKKAARALWTVGVRLDKDYDNHELKTQEYHGIYRAANYKIVGFWKRCQQVIEAMAAGYSGKFGGPNDDLFEYGPMTICGKLDVPSIRLPSGYILRYPGLRWQDDEYVYDRQRGKSKVTVRMYGSRLDENLCQATAFQILMWEACRMDEAGIALKGNNHDCWYTVVPEEQAEHTEQQMLYWMKQVPDWARGCPIDAESEVSTTFEVC